MKTISLFKRKVPILAIVMAVLVIGMASAALVTFFMQHNTTVNVTAPLYLNDNDEELDLVAGETYSSVVISVGNNASVPTLTEIVTGYDPDGDGINVHYTYNGETLCDVDNDGNPECVVPAGSDGEELEMHICTSSALAPDTYTITTNFTPAVHVGMLVLEDKDGDWAPMLENDITATLIFGTNEPEFTYCLTGVTKDPGTDYTLIYYADEPDRFVNWGGKNPGAYIANGTSSGTGSIEMSGSINLNMDLPHPDDANYDMTETDYREAPDFYCNGCGAKIWLVTSADAAGYPGLSNWTPGNYLYDTELIQYTDSDLPT